MTFWIVTLFTDVEEELFEEDDTSSEREDSSEIGVSLSLEATFGAQLARVKKGKVNKASIDFFMCRLNSPIDLNLSLLCEGTGFRASACILDDDGERLRVIRNLILIFVCLSSIKRRLLCAAGSQLNVCVGNL